MCVFQGENEKWGVKETAELAIATLQHVIASDFKEWLTQYFCNLFCIKIFFVQYFAVKQNVL